MALRGFYTNKCYRVEYELSLLECQNSDRRKINSGVSQGSVLGLLLFLICINDSPDGTMPICKIFSADTLLLSNIIDTRNSPNTLNSDLKSIKNSAHKWKMRFNPDLKEQAKEVIFSCTCTYRPVIFNNTIATCLR